MCLEAFILINITSNSKNNLLKKCITYFQFFENTFNKKVPLSGISGIYPEWHSTPYIVH